MEQKQKLDTSVSRVYWLRYSEGLCSIGLKCCTSNLQRTKILPRNVWFLGSGIKALVYLFQLLQNFTCHIIYSYCKSTCAEKTIKLQSVLRNALKFRVPVRHGWIQNDREQVRDSWMSGQTAPATVLQLLFFSSRTSWSSRLPNCSAAALWLVWSVQIYAGSPSVTTGEKKKL